MLLEQSKTSYWAPGRQSSQGVLNNSKNSTTVEGSTPLATTPIISKQRGVKAVAWLIGRKCYWSCYFYSLFRDTRQSWCVVPQGRGQVRIRDKQRSQYVERRLEQLADRI